MGSFVVVSTMGVILCLTLMARRQLHLRLRLLEEHHRRNPWLEIQREVAVCPSTGVSIVHALKGAEGP